jgi:5,10-methylenetetrahydromethanopterin reductase
VDDVMYGLPWPGHEIAQIAEAAGVGAFCTGEFVDHEAYSTLADMVAGTTSAHLGPAIAYAFARTPFAHASAIRSLAPRAPGRLFLGLGSGAFTVNRDWFGVPADRPVERLGDLVRAVQAWLHADNGEVVRYVGEFYRIDADVRAPVLGRLDVPVLVAGFNAKMARMSGAVADGIIGHGLFTDRWWDDVVRPAAEEGSWAAGRGAGLEHGWVITAVDDEDPARAVLDARRMIAFYLTVKTYDPFVALHGWQRPVAALREAFRTGDMAGMAAAVTDEMVSEIAVCGTVAQAREQLSARRSLAKDVVYLAPPSFLVSERRKGVYARNGLTLVGPVS